MPFGQLVEQFMTSEPYASAQRVFLVIDNGSAHRGQRSIDRLQGAWPNLIVVHTPVHASWMLLWCRGQRDESLEEASREVAFE